jgi:hypothetical protein
MKQQTAVEILFDRIKLKADSIPTNNQANRLIKGAYVDCLMLIREAKEMEKAQIGYTKADIIKAGEMGEINYVDTLNITTYLDEAKKFNETYGGNK